MPRTIRVKRGQCLKAIVVIETHPIIREQEIDKRNLRARVRRGLPPAWVITRVEWLDGDGLPKFRL